MKIRHSEVKRKIGLISINIHFSPKCSDYNHDFVQDFEGPELKTLWHILVLLIHPVYSAVSN